MVQSGESSFEEGRRLKVKLEVEDGGRDERGLISKRAKVSSSLFVQGEWDTGSKCNLPDPTLCNPLDEPSPLGLHLRKSPSLLDLIQMRLSQGSSATLGVCGLNELKSNDVKGTSDSATAEKLKASNFPASLLRIGKWECTSRYEGDLVAKCYYAKHKIVWEVLDSGLKNKIEIQWSDIMAIKASFPDGGPATLDIVLARQPLFFKETNPQPRKHTLWQATSDFTGGQASMHRRHFLQCPQGLLNKHFDKLVQCDPRLKLLSQRPDIILDSPFFDTESSVFENPADLESDDLDCPKDEYISSFQGFHCVRPSSSSPATSTVTEMRDKVYRTHETAPSATASSSVDNGGSRDNGIGGSEEAKNSIAFSRIMTPALQSSMSVSDWINHLDNFLTEQMLAGNPFFSAKGEGSRSKNILEEISQHLLSDSQFTSASDEQSLMTRVNSLCSLLQKDAVAVKSSQIKREDGIDDVPKFEPKSISNTQNFARPAFEENGSVKAVLGSEVEFCDDGSGRKLQSPTMSRKDSLADLLLQLPRITSLPQFLFNITEENDNQAR